MLEGRQRAKRGVSIHAPVKGATCGLSGPVSPHRCFNPRAREGRDFPLLFGWIHPIVSIHAPVKGATHPRTSPATSHAVSIHAPVKGATQERAGLLASILVSIHAPVKGATVDVS